MNEAEIISGIWQVNPEKHPSWSAFVTEMRNKSYGTESLNQAWYFFRTGWDAANAPWWWIGVRGENSSKPA